MSFVTALFAFGCGAPNTPTPPLVELGDRLSGRHIRALLSGATLYGRYVFYDATYVEYYDTDGSYLIERSRILGNSNKQNFEGQWKVRGNLLCIDHISYLDAGGCHELYYKDGSIQIVDPSTGSFVAFTTRIERGEELATVASPITPTPPPTPKPVQIPSQNRVPHQGQLMAGDGRLF